MTLFFSSRPARRIMQMAAGLAVVLAVSACAPPIQLTDNEVPFVADAFPENGKAVVIMASARLGNIGLINGGSWDGEEKVPALTYWVRVESPEDLKRRGSRTREYFTASSIYPTVYMVEPGTYMLAGFFATEPYQSWSGPGTSLTPQTLGSPRVPVFSVAAGEVIYAGKSVLFLNQTSARIVVRDASEELAEHVWKDPANAVLRERMERRLVQFGPVPAYMVKDDMGYYSLTSQPSVISVP